jgi:hypothetical protein
MEEQNIPEINVTDVCVLKLNHATNMISVDYEPIAKPLDKDFHHVINMAESTTYRAKDIVNYVTDYNLRIILLAYDYCSDLSKAYQGLPECSNEIAAKYSSFFNINLDAPGLSIEAPKKLKERLLQSQAKEKQSLMSELNDRLLAYYLNIAYKKLEAKRLKNEILAYSHRKVGWSTPKYDLNENFSIEIKTNFGYGGVSYFYTKIKYKNLDIIPFSDWVEYQYAHAFEIVRYSSTHSLKNDSWKDAMEFLCEACNLSTSDELAFVRKYILDECEKMVTGLEGILKNNKFKFCNWQRYYTDVEKEGHDLIEFRGEKISGALSFVQSIIQFSKVVEITSFIDRIENCNKIISPLLVNEIGLIKTELKQKNALLKVVKLKYDSLLRQNTFYEVEIKKFLLKITRAGQFQTFVVMTDVEDMYAQQNPNYSKFRINLGLVEKEYADITSQISSLESSLANIDKYNSAIKEYFLKLSRDAKYSSSR